MLGVAIHRPWTIIPGVCRAILWESFTNSIKDKGAGYHCRLGMVSWSGTETSVHRCRQLTCMPSSCSVSMPRKASCTSKIAPQLLRSGATKPIMSASSDTTRRPVRCIVKLGGAAVTVKDELETLNDEILSITAKQLRDATGLSSAQELSMDWSRRHASQESVLPDDDYPRDASLDMKSFVVVHGAGSFGHFQASRAKVNMGHLATPFVKAGFVATRISVSRLNLEVVRAFASEGIPAVSISPFCAGWSTVDRNLKLENSADVEQVLHAGFLPVLHGDAVLDTGQGCAILSGDVIVRQLAITLMPSYVVFLTNVAGVFDRPPSDPHAILLKEIAVENGSWLIVDPPSETGAKVETDAAEHDTTGGMATKIAEAASIASNGIIVLIAQCGSYHAMEALKGTPINSRDNWVGTIIRRARPGEIGP